MKMFIILTALFSLNAHALTCDLEVTVPEFEGGKKQTVKVSEDYVIRHSGNYTIDLGPWMNEVALKCEEEGGQNCKTSHSSKDGYRKTTFTVHAIGYKMVGGKKLSEAEMARKYKQLYCKKINSCINKAVMTKQVDSNVIEKLYMVKDKNNCHEVEEFIFS